ncbi:hypothetical protein TNCV_1477261 [Trichonephila clavipes]|nr:hypothetical protein TNCV_1477261 [Trichonephila clavipes]
MALNTSKFALSVLLLRPPVATFYFVWGLPGRLGSRSLIGFGFLQGEWTRRPDLTLLISGMRNNNKNTFRNVLNVIPGSATDFAV